jgi:K+-transporting ATPase KdpF subunit
MDATIILVAAHYKELNTTSGYIPAAIIALFILIYLFYSLIKPEKF